MWQPFIVYSSEVWAFSDDSFRPEIVNQIRSRNRNKEQLNDGVETVLYYTKWDSVADRDTNLVENFGSGRNILEGTNA